jgi:hypothetical protein
MNRIVTGATFGGVSVRDLRHRCNSERIGNDDGRFVVEAMPEYGGCVEIRMSGEIDLANEDRFAERLDECVIVPEWPSRWDFAPLHVFDMSQVSFLGVGGSRVIVRVAADLARRGAGAEVRGMSRIQRRVIELLDDQGLVRSGPSA